MNSREAEGVAAIGVGNVLTMSDSAKNMAYNAGQKIASSETAKLVIGMAGALAAGSLALYCLADYHRKKKSLEEKKNIDKIHFKYLASLTIIPPFVIDPTDGALKASTPFGKRIFGEYKQRPSFHDPVLDYHVEYILDAISWLERFYDARLERHKATFAAGKEDDNVSIVICYIAFFS